MSKRNYLEAWCFEVSRVSQKSFQKVAEQALSLLFEKYPAALATGKIASDLGRDNEFMDKVMEFLHGRRFVALARVSKSGRRLVVRKAWRLSSDAYHKYSHVSSAKSGGAGTG